MTTSIHVPPLPDDQVVGELKNILLAGVEQHPDTELAPDPDAADYVLLDFRHFGFGWPDPRYADTTIVVDYGDGHWPLGGEVLAYLKRSVVDPERGEFQQYGRPVVPIAYCIRGAYLDQRPAPDGERDIDISVFLRPERPPEEARNRYRAAVACLVEDGYGDLRTHVGIAGRMGEAGRNHFQDEYFSIMARSKIVVTCNPDRWEGDYRLFEALSSGAMVMVDRMITPVVHPFVDHEHLVYYDRTRLTTLSDAIDRYLADDDARVAIATAGHEHAMRHHTVVDRMSEILAAARGEAQPLSTMRGS